jgi:hypothetical protein
LISQIDFDELDRQRKALKTLPALNVDASAQTTEQIKEEEQKTTTPAEQNVCTF